MEIDGFVPITAIFYAVFHPTEGTKVLNQVPERSIGNSKDYNSSLFNFDTIKNYIIPKPKLCNKLISIKIDKFKVLGYPVNIENEKYTRNTFNFNFCFVFPYNSDTTPYESAIKRIGKMFQALEEQSFILSKLDTHGSFVKKDAFPTESSIEINDFITPGFKKTQKVNLSSIESLIHQVYQDLNNYSECCIPLDSANSVDIKLFPILPPPVNIKAFQVPILTVKLNLLVDINWDPTMLKILPNINGINSIKRISELADADYILTKQCIQHLMHYKCINMIDIFQFSNIYAPTNHIGDFLTLDNMAEECQSYIITNEFNSLSEITVNEDFESQANFPNSISPVSMHSVFKTKKKFNEKTITIPSKATLFYLYRSLNQGQTVKNWYFQHRKYLANIDIRRFINFGVIRGIIYRVNSYPILKSITKSIENNNHNELDEMVKYLMSKLQVKPSSAKESANDKLLNNIVHETNLKTGTAQSKRRVSFNYDVHKHTVDEMGESDNDIQSSDTDSINSIEPQIEQSEQEDLDQIALERDDNIIKLIKLLKGFQHLDSINTELQKSRTEMETLLNKLGPYDNINC